jgi:hypothetical protein
LHALDAVRAYALLLGVVLHGWFVRFTWIGAMLNGRRHPRPEKAPPTAPVTESA